MPALTAPTPSRLVDASGAELPLRAATLRAVAGAGHARVVVEQTFVNDGDLPLEVTYQLPLPADGAVAGFAFTLDDRRIEGRIDRRADARRAYEDALFEGRAAGLLEQTRDSLFTQSLGNVPPRSTVRVEVTVDQPLAWEDGWCWRFPTVVGPRYVDAATVDAADLAVDVASGPLPARLGLSLTITDALTGPVSSSSHAVSGSPVVLDGGRARLDRDVVVRWPVSRPEPGITARFGVAGGERVALLTVVPPVVPSTPVARDLILLLDVSGSMHGAPLEQAKAACRALVEGLAPGDSLEMVAFGGRIVRWRKGATAMDLAGRNEALRWLGGLQAAGGTPMDEGLREALKGLRDDAQRQVLLVTDGYIGFEARIVGMVRDGLPRSSRVHVLGVGSAVNRSLTTPVARAGAGIEVIVAPGEPVGPVTGRLLAVMAAPQVVDLVVDGASDPAPARLPDLLAGSPARLLVRVEGPLRVRGRTAEGGWSMTVPGPESWEDAPDLGRLWARERVADLEMARAAGAGADVDGSIEALGLRFGIATRLTSFVAVSDQAVVDPTQATRTVKVPHELPAHVSAARLGLAAPGGAVPPMARMPMAAPVAPPPAEPLLMREEGAPTWGAAKPAKLEEPAPAPKKRSLRRLRAPEGLMDRASRFVRDLFGSDEEVAGAVPEAPIGVGTLLRLVRRIRRDGELRLELELVQGTWTLPETVTLHLGTGPVEARVLAGSTASGASAGTRVRLVVALPGDAEVVLTGLGWDGVTVEVGA